MKIVVTGSNGLLGSNLLPHLNSLGHDVVGLSRCGGNGTQCDLCDRDASFSTLNSLSPDIIVNLVALPDVDECEANPNKAFLLNCRTAETIAAWHNSSPLKPSIIHISTDQVYGSEGGPHKESDASPPNTYSISKLKAESAISSCGALIIRTNFFGLPPAPPYRGFIFSLFESIKSGESPIISSDTLFNPLYIPTLAGFIGSLIERFKPGVFNLGSSGGMQKGAFVSMLASRMGLSYTPKKPLQKESPRTPRPIDMRMDCSLFERAFSIKLPSIEEEIEKAAADMKGRI